MAEFRIECHQNEFLPLAAEMVHAVLTVTASGTGADGASGTAAVATPQDRSEVLIVDTSGSMSGRKMRAAKAATTAAIDGIPDGVRFGIVAGKHKAVLAFPSDPPLVPASVETRAEAKAAVKNLETGGGTAMGTWIELAASVLDDVEGIRHAILLTDGKNENETPEQLDAALARAEGVFQCDCRGVGSDWNVAELRKVATALVGSYDIVPDPSELEEDFASMMREALSREVARVTLRIWTPQGADVVAFKQIDPPLDFTGGRVEVGPLTGDYATGSWGDEARDYQLSVRVPAGEVDDEMLAARVTLMVGEEQSGQCLVKATWTDDPAKSTQMHKQVANALGMTELEADLLGGAAAVREGDDSTATDRFTDAGRKAKELGNEEALARLREVADEDPVTGRFRPKANVEEIDLMTLETRSTRTSRNPRRKASDDAPPPPGEPS